MNLRVRIVHICLGLGFFLFMCDGLQLKPDYYEKAALELKSLIGDMLQEDFRLLDLKSMLDNGLHCTACTLIAEIINDKRSYLKFNRSYMDILLRAACSVLQTANLMSYCECHGLVNVFSDQILFLINNAEDIRTVCPILFQQYACSEVRKSHYSIRISTQMPKPGKKSTFKPDEMTPLRILHLTDVHFDPTYKPGSNAKCLEHLCCMSNSGEALDIKDRAGYWTDYRDCDVSDYFIEDTFDHISRNNQFDYIYFTGDIISHKLWDTTKVSILRDMYFFWRLFKDYFSGYKVFPVLGNHDIHPCNLFPPPNVNDGKFSIQWLFNATAEFWKDFLPDEALITIRKGGYYSVSPKEGFRIIAINSNIGYSYNFWLLLDDKDPYDQLQWLADELHKAEMNNEAVHILSHVMAGADMVSSWAEQLRHIIRRCRKLNPNKYHNCIHGIFNGHTHSDVFNVYYSFDDKPISAAYNGGSITPYSNVNPNYKIYHVDPTVMDVYDYDTYMLNLTEANQHWKHRPRWHKLYSFRHEYGVDDATPRSMHALVKQLVRDERLRHKYYRNAYSYGPTSLQTGCDIKCQKALICDIVSTVHTDKAFCEHLQKQMGFINQKK